MNGNKNESFFKFLKREFRSFYYWAIVSIVGTSALLVISLPNYLNDIRNNLDVWFFSSLLIIGVCFLQEYRQDKLSIVDISECEYYYRDILKWNSPLIIGMILTTAFSEFILIKIISIILKTIVSLMNEGLKLWCCGKII